MITVILIIKALLEVSIIILIYLITALVSIFVANKSQLYYKSWQAKKINKRWEQQHEEFLQRVRRKELRKREREKYPLFYWKELIEEKLEDGNF